MTKRVQIYRFAATADADAFTPREGELLYDAEGKTLRIGDGATAGGTKLAKLSVLTAGYQPLDTDLTAIAALATTAYGRAFLTLADQAALVALLPSYQPLDSDLTAIAALTTTSYGRALLALANEAALVALLATDFQPLDADLTAIAALTTTSVGRSLLAAANAAAIATIAGLSSVAQTLAAQTTQALMRTTGLGSTTVGDAVFIAASGNAAITAIQASKSQWILALAGENNITGDGTQYQRTGTELLDTLADGASNAFTARVTGPHLIVVNDNIEGYSAGTTAWLVRVKQNTTIVLQTNIDPVIMTGGSVCVALVGVVNLTAGDTVKLFTEASGGTKTADANGSTVLQGGNYFGVFLLG